MQFVNLLAFPAQKILENEIYFNNGLNIEKPSLFSESYFLLFPYYKILKDISLE